MLNITFLNIRSLCFIMALVCGFQPRIAVSQDKSSQQDTEDLRRQVEELSRYSVRTQSHIMMDVEYHFANLWFAAGKGQWDLAAFYLRESRSHLGWMVKIRPVRKVPGGGSVDLHPLQKSINSEFAVLGDTIENNDLQAFKAAYQQTLTQCHDCHQAAGLGYLEPHIPERPPSTMMINGE